MDNMQFDEFLGGAVALPRAVEINNLIAARAHEIHDMSYKIGRLTLNFIYIINY